MNNTGSDSPLETNESDSLPESRRVPIKIIVMGLIAIVFAVVIGSQVISILYAIFFPPAPPVPDQSTLVSHSSKDYGVDDWYYSSKQSACDVYHYYESQDGQCRVAPIACDANETQSATKDVNGVGQNVARCVGTQNFSIFALRWEVVIATGAASSLETEFRLNREIYWTGAVPPSNPPTLDGGLPGFVEATPEPTRSS
jgi:hypothetical protein